MQLYLITFDINSTGDQNDDRNRRDNVNNFLNSNGTKVATTSYLYNSGHIKEDLVTLMSHMKPTDNLVCAKIASRASAYIVMAPGKWERSTNKWLIDNNISVDFF